MDGLLAALDAATDELAALYEERGLVVAAAITARADTFQDLIHSDMNITAVREHASHAAAGFDAETAKLSGQIDAMRARIHLIDQQLLASIGDDGAFRSVD